MTKLEQAARRRPAQDRSKVRFDQILTAASELLSERGIEPITMTDIATRSGMAVTAVYRYFPSKRAIVRELALRTVEEDAEALTSRAKRPATSVEAVIAEGVLDYWQRHVEEPARLQLRLAIQADVELSALDLADSRRNAAVLAQMLSAAGSPVDIETLEIRSLLFIEMLDSLMRLVSRIGKTEADLIVSEFVEMEIQMLGRPAASE
jgi:AcrR family transcriptional regulator